MNVKNVRKLLTTTTTTIIKISEKREIKKNFFFVYVSIEAIVEHMFRNNFRHQSTEIMMYTARKIIGEKIELKFSLTLSIYQMALSINMFDVRLRST